MGAGRGWRAGSDPIRQLTSGDTLPSAPHLARFLWLKPGTVRHAFLALADEGLVHIRPGRSAMIAGEPAADEPGTRPR